MKNLIRAGIVTLLAVGAMSGGSIAQAADTTPDGGGEAARKEVCGFTERADNPHYSSTTSGVLNVHGWWEWNSSTSSSCKSKYKEAKVTIYLQSSLDGKKWTTRAQGNKTVPAGGGSNNRAVAPLTCKNYLLTKWRGKVDVDVIGLADDPSQPSFPMVEVKCGY